MFDVKRLSEIIMEVSHQFRKGAEVTNEDRPGGIQVTHVYMMPHTDQAPSSLAMVDVWFINVGVDRALAEARREEIVGILNQWPDQSLKSGLSYITIGGVLGSQDLALMLLAIGKVLGFWNIVTPAIAGLKYGDPKADEMAGVGFIMASGYKTERVSV
jgi:hypothetical protein